MSDNMSDPEAMLRIIANAHARMALDAATIARLRDALERIESETSDRDAREIAEEALQ